MSLLRLGLMFCLTLIIAQSMLIAQSSLVSVSREAEILSVNKIFTDHMVLQRDQPIHIWGRGLPGAAVKVSLSRTSLSIADSKTLSSVVKSVVTSVRLDSSWSVNLPALKASTTPHEIKINSGKKNIRISNVLMGDIWICIGQSNMEWPMQREMYYREAIKTANQPLLRFYNPTYAGKNVFNQYFSDSVLQMMQPEKFFAPTSWQVSDSNSFRAMSAVAYYYGKSIVTNTQVPIGLINLSIAGAPLETFIGVDALKSDERFAAKAIEPWLTNPAIPIWVKERGNQNLRVGTNHPFKPGFTYTAGIEPLFPLAIKGIINYQGESNAQEMERVNEYAALTQLMVQDYRTRFKQSQLPYYYVQLSSIDTLKYKGHFWGTFRNEQRKILDLIPNSGMAVCTDYGLNDNVHPTNKKIVGERLAKWALSQTYKKNILASGPLPLRAQYANGKLIVEFKYVGGGLKTSDGMALRGFSLDGIHSAEATIQQNSIHILSSTKPEMVYYGWKSFNEGNLVNKEELPASTFKIKVDVQQILLPQYPDSIFNTYYHQRYSLFKALPNDAASLSSSKRDIIFLGNSINDGSEWYELFNDIRIKNRGISGDITAGILHRLTEISNRKPAKVFLMIGINDLGRGLSPDSVAKNILLMNDYLQQESPNTQVYIQSILPVNPSFGKFAGQTSKREQINQTNALLKAASTKHHYEFIDLHSEFVDAQGNLDAKYTNDGLHLVGAGYMHWRHLIYPKVFGLTHQPALIPMPKQVKWNKEYYTIDPSKSLAAQVKIELISSAQHKEWYELIVRPNQITIKAATQHGVFNALQTLQQLARNGQTIVACEIKDAPAFAWRGYMIDVGRNYMSMNLLKQQIDIMAKYKLNVFHFHATEDIAWRIALKQYPQLTAPENMLRNKGMYYTEAEIKELIAYCKARNILFVPEIDMPGHSAAFKRAMKVDMQSDSGMVYIKNILKEFCTTYDIPYIHIGADEVKITNPNFIPEITRYIQSFGKKVIGWQPGGNFLDSTIRQLWMDDLGKITNNKQVQYIDSRHLYLNHMDPLESVTTIFNRQLANRDSGNHNALGAIICTWHDRAVATQDNVLTMNPVYPAMLAFAERSWNGGGKAGWVANISDGNEKAYVEFEQRLLSHQEQYFKELSFPYQAQAALEWKLYGPFTNNPNAKEDLWPEQNSSKYFHKTVKGGTVVLRHWWAPLIKGAIDSLKPNTVWYATTKIWSNENETKPFWIGFNNLSRSPATDSPPAFAWNEQNATVQINGTMVLPPVWKRAGQKGNAEIPLIDEGYEYREPTMIPLKKGWNEVRIKMPIGKLSGKDWQNPAKYMFTFVPVVR
ncbi:MAG: hypothetical protein B7Y37_13345 [Sphingobacteriia bacterium 28-36-52]|nr:MAG: hypothetical protein B7Y37_13345 [Sphingobacteriia bacterium 28-36-52]